MALRGIYRVTMAGALSLGLSACVGGEAMMQETTRSLARSAVDASVRQYLPGVNVSPYTDCVINGANTAELFQLANAATAGANGAANAWPVVRNITARADVQNCLLRAVQSNPTAMLGQLI